MKTPWCAARSMGWCWYHWGCPKKRAPKTSGFPSQISWWILGSEVFHVWHHEIFGVSSATASVMVSQPYWMSFEAWDTKPHHNILPLLWKAMRKKYHSLNRREQCWKKKDLHTIPIKPCLNRFTSCLNVIFKKHIQKTIFQQASLHSRRIPRVNAASHHLVEGQNGTSHGAHWRRSDDPTIHACLKHSTQDGLLAHQIAFHLVEGCKTYQNGFQTTAIHQACEHDSFDYRCPRRDRHWIHYQS